MPHPAELSGFVRQPAIINDLSDLILELSDHKLEPLHAARWDAELSVGIPVEIEGEVQIPA